MKKAVYIQANDKQEVGAIVSRFSFNKHLSDKEIEIHEMNVDANPAFKAFAGKAYLRKGREIVYDPEDLQSFTLSRFMPPELMGYEGRALVVDPDVFALTDVSELFAMDLQGRAIAACPKKGAWDTSMMVLDCAKLRHWKIGEILEGLAAKKLDYDDVITIRNEPAGSVLDMPRTWNNLDTLAPDTRMIHTTERLTQPWKTGLKIDFTRNPMPRILGVIPREWVLKVRGKWPSTYQPHPNRAIEKLFWDLTREALAAGALREQDLRAAIEAGDVRKDALAVLKAGG